MNEKIIEKQNIRQSGAINVGGANADITGHTLLKPQKRHRSATRIISRAAIIAALYTALTLACAPIAYGPIQFRISEAMVLLPLICPEAVIGLTVGCFLSNIFTSPWDMLLGSLATLVAALLTLVLRKVWLGWIPPVVLNGLIVPVVFLLTDIPGAYWFNALTVAAGELAVVVVLGIPMFMGLKNLKKRYPTLFY